VGTRRVAGRVRHAEWIAQWIRVEWQAE